MNLLLDAYALLYWISTAAYCLLVLLLIVGWLKGKSVATTTKATTSISVVVAARNEEANIHALLESR